MVPDPWFPRTFWKDSGSKSSIYCSQKKEKEKNRKEGTWKIQGYLYKIPVAVRQSKSYGLSEKTEEPEEYSQESQTD
ncbi:hypothetical protein P7H15_24000 [Paenibacillus larvae]|nr:hypothetical protein [Paenibacillus larvae]MDT2295249.1 hypothetical protein [Paenibacillus larvae]